MTSPFLSDDPMAALFVKSGQGSAIPLRYRSGVLTSWNLSTGENTVRIDGADFTNLPIMPGTYLGVAQQGDTVALLSTTDERGISTYVIQGLSLTPPDSRIARASGKPGRTYDAYETAVLAGTVNSSSYVDLGNTQSSTFTKLVTGSPVLFTLFGTFFVNNVDDVSIAFAVGLDATTDYLVLEVNASNEAYLAHTPYSRSVQYDGIAAGVHAVRPRWKRISGTGIGQVGGDSLTMIVEEIF